MSLNLPTQLRSLMMDYRFSIKNRFEVLMIFAILGTSKSSVYRKCFSFSLFLARNSLLACIDKLPTLSISFRESSLSFKVFSSAIKTQYFRPICFSFKKEAIFFSWYSKITYSITTEMPRVIKLFVKLMILSQNKSM